MIDHPDEYDEAIAGAHTSVVRADVLSDGAVIASDVPILSGTVTGDRSQFARRTCDVVLGDPDLAPLLGDPAEALTPYGHELRLYRGLVLPSGEPWLAPLGTFRLKDANRDWPWQGTHVTGVDRCAWVSDDRFPFPRSFRGSSIADNIRALLAESVPFAGLVVDPAIADHPIGSVTYDRDRDGAIKDLATALGAEVYCNPQGDFVLAPIPDPTGPQDWTVSDGRVIVSAQRILTRDGVYNGCVAAGQSLDPSAPPPTSRLIIDDDPTSPTWWDGPFGHVPTFYSSSLLTSGSQCDTAAIGILRDHKGLPKSITWGSWVDATKEPGDVGLIEVGGLRERHIMERITYDLAPGGSMSADSRNVGSDDTGLS